MAKTIVDQLEDKMTKREWRGTKEVGNVKKSEYAEENKKGDDNA